MPIYAYKCASCGHQQDVLQKVSDAPLTDCPSCGAPALTKQVTAAGFQLKGNGWYATDFKNGSAAKANGKDKAAVADGGDKDSAAKSDDKGMEASKSSTEPAPASAPPAASKAASPVPAGGSGAAH